jgi:hypothetical protein
MKIRLGQVVKDKITGLTGVVMGRTEYLTNCTHVGIMPKKLDNNGVEYDWIWIDERRCIATKQKDIIIEDNIIEEKDIGGP